MADKLFRTAKYGYILISVLLCLTGVMLAAVPDFSISLLCRISGLLLILFGIVKIIGYFSKDLYCLVFQHDLAVGILMIALGVILIVRFKTMTNVICVFMGIYVLIDALLKIQISIDARAFGIFKWWLLLAVATGTGIVGFLLVLRPSESASVIMRILGIALLMEGVLNLVAILTSAGFAGKQDDQIIEEEYKKTDY